MVALLTSSNSSRNLVGCFLTPSPHVILPALTQEGSEASRCLIFSREIGRIDLRVGTRSRSAPSCPDAGRVAPRLVSGESLFGVAKTQGYQQGRIWS